MNHNKIGPILNTHILMIVFRVGVRLELYLGARKVAVGVSRTYLVTCQRHSDLLIGQLNVWKDKMLTYLGSPISTDGPKGNIVSTKTTLMISKHRYNIIYVYRLGNTILQNIKLQTS